MPLSTDIKLPRDVDPMSILLKGAGEKLLKSLPADPKPAAAAASAAALTVALRSRK